MCAAEILRRWGLLRIYWLLIEYR